MRNYKGSKRAFAKEGSYPAFINSLREVLGLDPLFEEDDRPRYASGRVNFVLEYGDKKCE